MSDVHSISYREARTEDAEAIASIYSHHWCNYVDDPLDKMQAARLCVLADLVRSPIVIVAEEEGRVVGVCMGCVTEGGKAPVEARWKQMFDETFAWATERAKSADAALEGQLFGDIRELEVADAFIATGDPHAEAQVNLFMVEPWLKGRGIGGELLSRVKARLHEAGAKRFFLMTDTESDYGYYERRGMSRIWEKFDDPDDPASWGVLMYGGEL